MNGRNDNIEYAFLISLMVAITGGGIFLLSQTFSSIFQPGFKGSIQLVIFLFLMILWTLIGLNITKAIYYNNPDYWKKAICIFFVFIFTLIILGLIQTLQTIVINCFSAGLCLYLVGIILIAYRSYISRNRVEILGLITLILGFSILLGAFFKI